MNTKILIILIILIGLGVGGFFILKKEVPSKEKETSLVEEIPIQPKEETTTEGGQLSSDEEIQESQETPPSAEKPKELNLNWQEDAGIRVSDGSVPYIYKLKDGRYRLYYCGAGGILSAISPDGLNFQKEAGARAKGMVDPAIIVLPDGEYLLLVVSLDPKLSPYLPRGIYSYLSEDGLNFENRKVVLQKEGVYDPTIIKIDSESYRIYYGEDIGGKPGQPSIVTRSLIGRIK